MHGTLTGQADGCKGCNDTWGVMCLGVSACTPHHAETHLSLQPYLCQAPCAPQQPALCIPPSPSGVLCTPSCSSPPPNPCAPPNRMPPSPSSSEAPGASRLARLWLLAQVLNTRSARASSTCSSAALGGVTGKENPGPPPPPPTPGGPPRPGALLLLAPLTALLLLLGRRRAGERHRQHQGSRGLKGQGAEVAAGLIQCQGHEWTARQDIKPRGHTSRQGHARCRSV
jgi:hypothetical protein